MKKDGFTLAEVLITLGIIGVVAALTMPALIQKYKEKVTVSQLKKAYATISNAYILALQEHGEFETWFPDGLTRAENTVIFFNNIKPYLRISKDCGHNPGCFNPNPMKILNGETMSSYDDSTYEYRFILSDGSSWSIDLASPNCISDTFCANDNMKLDIDGLKGANTQGKDIFMFQIVAHRIYPMGIKDESSNPLFSTNCNRLSSLPLQSSACAAWVIYNENMDYLHCDDLDWDVKTKCD
ncbi:MAG: prepilin-type N-terminal cleavage/methylation domain-containing protein [Heliobacteriaceae bacterium]|jgi:prepilin-type N-terminal cleavage/methylation domain-containing protein|nr:prepilin-type N-terminal cleavage/methylation domain-containing protein [Heliobacteriaceae bacterium]